MKALTEMQNFKAYTNEYGLDKVEDDYGDTVYSMPSHVIFPNFYCASILAKKNDDGEITHYSVAMCDWNGYFDWNIMNEYGAVDGVFKCYSENDVIEACEIIRSYQGKCC